VKLINILITDFFLDENQLFAGIDNWLPDKNIFFGIPVAFFRKY
jgi:hypothetical protein